jgi:orotidine-5'-phosphate decarboxylase
MTKEKIIVALDVPTEVEARNIVAELSGAVGAFKVGLQLFTAAGPQFVRELTAAGHRIFLDLKFHDIPNTVAMASVEAARLGVWMFNVHAVGGGEMMKKALTSMREICEKEGLATPKMIAVTVLTSSNQETLSETGVSDDLDRQVLNLAQLTAKCGLDGVVASPREVARLRDEIAPKDFLLVTPAVRPAFETDFAVNFATGDDQTRVMTPGHALRAGSDYLVIGRPILQSRDRLEAVKKIVADIK